MKLAKATFKWRRLGFESSSKNDSWDEIRNELQSNFLVFHYEGAKQTIDLGCNLITFPQMCMIALIMHLPYGYGYPKDYLIAHYLCAKYS